MGCLFRLQVLELKTHLQRVRASNDRRRAKLSERWIGRVKAAAMEKEAAEERHRGFAGKLYKDVEDLEEKLGGLERQVSTHISLERSWYMLRT